MKKWGSAIGLGILLTVGVLGSPSVVGAAGKSKPAAPTPVVPPTSSAPNSPPPSCQAPGGPGSSPIRKVVIKPVASKPFQLPNGANVDLTADLNELLSTVVTETRVLSPTDPNDVVGPCDHHIEIRSGVSWLELNVTQYGLTFGYTPSGAKSTITSLTGNVGVKIGSIRMDFKIWECVGGKCSSVKAAYADQKTASVDLALEINFGEVTTGPSLIHNTALGKAMSKIMQKAIGEIAASPRLTELSWSANVRKVTAETGILVFDAGSRSNIKVGDQFIVYAAANADAACSIFDAVAYVHAVRVDPISTVAVVDQVLTPERSVQLGDLILVRDQPGSTAASLR